ncbi:Uroporphyrinogen-III synthase isoform 1 [Schistosoma japonicum]|uniref:Uroporphyrinogen-III synthase isoform 1 n=1 Tax=Schistosoma japonicum TaxID=6182 RepID=A0A4Z2DS45_SCHJA|nr:Uroporphyrinogen-III synthase isoform 1 [Schistosoma japonicum]
MYVVLLKSAGDNTTSINDDPYVQILAKSGFNVNLLETLDFEYNTSNLAEYKNWRNNHSCIVFSSPRAVISYVKAGLTGNENDLCFVVGPSTELQAKKAGFSPKGSDSGDAVKLADFILKHYSSKLDKPIFFPSGQVHLDTLPKVLENAGKKVNTVVAYSSVENTQLHEKLRLNLCEGNPIPECLVYFSPSGVSLTEKILITEIKPHRPNIKVSVNFVDFFIVFYSIKCFDNFHAICLLVF